MTSKVNAEFEKIFENNYIKYSGSVVRFLYRILSDVDISIELSQETFLRYYEKKEYINPETPGAINYLFTIARNVAYDHIRRVRIEEKKMRKILNEEVCINEKFYEDVEDIYIEGEVISTLNDTINSFPEEEKQVFIEKTFGQKSLDEISTDFNLSNYIVKKISRKVKDKIKRDLKDYYDNI